MSIISKKAGQYRYALPTFDNIRPGTKLLVKSHDWWCKHRELVLQGFTFSEPMSRLCGQVVEVEAIKDLNDTYMYLGLYPKQYLTVVESDGNPNGYLWTPEMFERIIE